MTTDQFASRHNGPRAHEINAMLKKIGVESIEQLIQETVPSHIRLKSPLSTGEAMSHSGPRLPA